MAPFVGGSARISPPPKDIVDLVRIAGTVAAGQKAAA